MTQSLVIPHNTQAEQAVIGGLMLDPSRSESVFNKLKAESFYNFAHKRIYEAMQKLHAENKPLDIVTLDNFLTVEGILKEVGGFAYLAELSKNTPSAANVLAYADVVREAAIKRFSISKLNECGELLYSGKPADEILDNISTAVSQISDYAKVGKAQGAKTSNEIAQEWLNEIEERHNNPDLHRGLTTGIAALDELLAPKYFIKGGLYAVGARPKVGKTSLYAQIALNCVMVEQKRAVLFSLEMSRKQIFERMVGQFSKTNTNEFHKPSALANDELTSRLYEAIGVLTQSDLLLIDDTPAVSMAHIRGECRRIVRERGEIGLVAVDYLTLMTAEQAERNDLAYGNIVKGLKNLARELNCVVVLLVQLNRGNESRADKRPQPSDSRDTGQIEQEVDGWIGIHRESMFREEADKHLTELIVRSNRHGETGTVYVDYRFGAIFQIDQHEAKERAVMGRAKHKTRGGF